MTETEKKYFDAKNDLIKALNSFRKLEPWQKEQLAKELLGADVMAAFLNIIQQYQR